LQSVKPEKFIWIQEQMKKIVPNYLKFRIELAKVAAKDWFNITDQNKYLEDIISRRSGTGQQLIFDFVNASDIAVEFVSEGTLFALTVLVAVASSEGETVLLIDDLERGLHPSAVREMIKALREIQKITPELQIIATSHSPYILDKLEPKEVRVVAFDPEIGTMVASLEEYPNFEKWRDAMTPGEFWSFVGEDWVKELYAERLHV
jgi:predicted ATP-dependent endonuclease of OLD family